MNADLAQIEKLAAAQIFHHRDVVLASQRGQFFQRRLLGESDNLEVGAMHAQQQFRSLGDGGFVIGDAGAIRRPHFAKHRAGLRHHIGNAERTADLDQFAARDDDFPALGQRVQGQQHGGGVVVDHNGRDFALRQSSTVAQTSD